MAEKLFFVGPGRVGLALGHALWQANAVTEILYCGRRPAPPTHPLFTQGLAGYHFGLRRPDPGTAAVFLTVPDDVLPEMAHALAGQGAAPPGCAAFHCSGALSSEVLAPLHTRGYSVGSLHPLQSVAHPLTGADRLPGSWFALSGEREALIAGRRILGALGAHAMAIPVAWRPLYHASAVMASNYLAALLGAATRILTRAGIGSDEALLALLNLARGTLDNIEEMGLGQALTGPVVRGDVETVRLHLHSLEPRDERVYRVLGSELTRLGQSLGLDGDTMERMAHLLAAPGRDGPEDAGPHGETGEVPAGPEESSAPPGGPSPPSEADDPEERIPES